MKAYYATELKWVGYDKRDTVACECVYWFQVVMHMVRCGREWMELAIGSYIFENGLKIKKWMTNYQLF
jgi:hypothetical protein